MERAQGAAYVTTPPRPPRLRVSVTNHAQFEDGSGEQVLCFLLNLSNEGACVSFPDSVATPALQLYPGAYGRSTPGEGALAERQHGRHQVRRGADKRGEEPGYAPPHGGRLRPLRRGGRRFSTADELPRGVASTDEPAALPRASVSHQEVGQSISDSPPQREFRITTREHEVGCDDVPDRAGCR